MTLHYGVYRAQITNVNDPLNQNRVRCLIPQILHSVESGWALPLFPQAVLPRAGDNIYVLFEGGSTQYPIWIGTSHGLYVSGEANSNAAIAQISDYNNAPIAWVAPIGGLSVNDNIATTYGGAVGGYGPPGFQADIYGYRFCGQMAEFAWGGPPGNMITFSDACHEVYQVRTLTVGSWSGVSGTASLATVEQDQHGTPTRYRGTVRVTNTNNVSGCTVAQTGGTFATPAVAGQTYNALVNLKQNAAAATRAATVYIGWYNSSGTFLSNSTAGASTNVTTSWTTVTVSATAPASTAYAQICFTLTSLSTETHDLCGAGLWNFTNTTYAPPFVGQPAGIALSGGAKLGDRYYRLDTPSTVNQRTYICTTAGYPYQQVWTAIA